jgi:hypothetical protein
MCRKKITKLVMVEFKSNPNHNTQQILPSGIVVIGINSWVERFEKVFKNALLDKNAYLNGQA